MTDSDSIRQLLTEIRDAQRESLQLQRDAAQFTRDVLSRQRMTWRYSLPFMIVPFIFAFFPLYMIWQMRSRNPFPTRSPSPFVTPPTPRGSGS